MTKDNEELKARDIQEFIDDFEAIEQLSLERCYNNHLDWVKRIRSYANPTPHQKKASKK
tara:strand:- start:23 stop:199 length:177 start_codon:yes stop_codon:yes gene_type:complete